MRLTRLTAGLHDVSRLASRTDCVLFLTRRFSWAFSPQSPRVCPGCMTSDVAHTAAVLSTGPARCQNCPAIRSSTPSVLGNAVRWEPIRRIDAESIIHATAYLSRNEEWREGPRDHELRFRKLSSVHRILGVELMVLLLPLLSAILD